MRDPLAVRYRIPAMHRDSSLRYGMRQGDTTMRLKSLLLALAALIGLTFVPIDQAAADGMKRTVKKSSVVRKHHVHKYAFKPDRYAYEYRPRGYYPYYNSAYYAPARYVRERAHMHYYHWIDVKPPYFKSWGHPRKRWNQRAWHAHHHGYIRRHHW